MTVATVLTMLCTCTTECRKVHMHVCVPSRVWSWQLLIMWYCWTEYLRSPSWNTHCYCDGEINTCTARLMLVDTAAHYRSLAVHSCGLVFRQNLCYPYVYFAQWKALPFPSVRLTRVAIPAERTVLNGQRSSWCPSRLSKQRVLTWALAVCHLCIPAVRKGSLKTSLLAALCLALFPHTGASEQRYSSWLFTCTCICTFVLRVWYCFSSPSPQQSQLTLWNLITLVGIIIFITCTASVRNVVITS